MIKLHELYGPLLEDSRGSIVKLLKFPREYADIFHDRDPKRSFAIANAFRLWWSTHHAGGRKHGVDWTTKLLHEPQYIDQTRYINWNVFVREIDGKRFIEAIKDPNVEKKVKSAKSFADVKAALPQKESRGEKLMDLGSGWSWIRLDCDEHDIEGDEMQHCATDDRGDLVSLRDQNNKPHVTMTYDDQTNAVYQIKGKQNKQPDQKYLEAIIKFFDKTKAKLFDGEITGQFLIKLLKHATNATLEDHDVLVLLNDMKLYGLYEKSQLTKLLEKAADNYTESLYPENIVDFIISKSGDFDEGLPGMYVVGTEHWKVKILVGAKTIIGRSYDPPPGDALLAEENSKVSFMPLTDDAWKIVTSVNYASNAYGIFPWKDNTYWAKYEKALKKLYEAAISFGD